MSSSKDGVRNRRNDYLKSTKGEFRHHQWSVFKVMGYKEVFAIWNGAVRFMFIPVNGTALAQEYVATFKPRNSAS